MSTTTAMMAAGIFAHESGQRLLSILLSLGERGFKGLYDKCARNLEGEYYQAGLRRVNAWSDAVLKEDIDFVQHTCPDFEETYESCFVQYVADRYRGRKRPTVRTPSLLEFVRRFLESLGQHEALATGDYFTKRDTMLKRVACMDAARTALYALMTAENVRVELLSEAGSMAPPPARKSMPSSEESKDVRPLAEASEADLRGASVADMEVTPGDSVSQIGGGRAPPPPSAPPPLPAAPASVASRASRRDTATDPREGAPASSSSRREGAPTLNPRRAPSIASMPRDDVDDSDDMPRRQEDATLRRPASVAPSATEEYRQQRPAVVGAADEVRSTTSRHDFAVEETPDEEVLVHHKPAAPRNSGYRISSSSSRAPSNVSIGVKQARSPKL